MTKLEDYLRSEPDPILPPNLIEKREEFIQEIDAVIDDGGISGQPFSLDEVMELESKNYPNAEINEGVRFRDWVLNTDHDHVQNLKNIGYEFDSVSKDEIEEEHFVDHEDYYFDPEWFKENRLKGEGENDSVTFDYNVLEPETNKLPLYLMNDAEIVGYPDEEFQGEIYEWVRKKIFDLEYNKFSQIFEFSIKDLGAGRGDFYSVFKNSNYKIDYFGIELNPNLCRVGEIKYPGIKLFNDDFNQIGLDIQVTDYTICIGTLNDDHGFDKWEYFNKTLNHALNNTKTAILFVLQGNCYGEQGHLDYPIPPLVSELPYRIGWEIDNSRFEDIYLLTVHIGSFN